MIYCKLPTLKEQLNIQLKESSAYWSSFAEAWFKKWGIIVINKKAEIPCFCWIGRGQKLFELDRNIAGFFEGPFSKDWLSELNLSALSYSTELVEMQVEKIDLGNKFGYSQTRTRKIPLNRKINSEPFIFQDDNPLLSKRTVKFQVFDFKVKDCWKVVAKIWVNKENKMMPVVITDGRRIVSGIPIMDLIGHKHWMPKYVDGYFDSIIAGPHWKFEVWLKDLCLKVALNNDLPIIQSRPWPMGKKSALTIRHDHDRDINNETLEDILKFYSKYKVKASWGFLNKLLPKKQMQRISNLGHEIVLHSEAPYCQSMEKEVTKIKECCDVTVTGVTCHGGSGSRGYLGDRTFEWAIKAGLSYSEILGKQNLMPHPVIRWNGRQLEISPFYSSPCHHSLDLGTKIDDHAHDYLISVIPDELRAGGCVNLMNHPDIHITQLKSLIKKVLNETVWLSTHSEQIQWCKEARYDINCKSSDSKVILSLPKKASNPIIFDLIQGKFKKSFIFYQSNTNLEIDLKRPQPSDLKSIIYEEKKCFKMNKNVTNRKKVGIITYKKENSDLILSKFSNELSITKDALTYVISVAALYEDKNSRSFFHDDLKNKFNIIVIDPACRQFLSSFGEAFIKRCKSMLVKNGQLYVPKRKFIKYAHAMSMKDFKSILNCDIQNSSGSFWKLSNFLEENKTKKPSIINWYTSNSEKILNIEVKDKTSSCKALTSDKKSILQYEARTSHAYLVNGVGNKSEGVKNIIKQNKLPSNNLSMLDIGGGIGALLVELILDPNSPISSGVVRDHSSLYQKIYNNLVQYYSEFLENRIEFSLGDAKEFKTKEKYDIITIFGTLLYLRKDLKGALENAWEKLKLNGILIIHENIKNQNYISDYSKMFAASELDEVLCPFGKITYFYESFVFPIPRFFVKNRTVFRVIKKIH